MHERNLPKSNYKRWLPKVSLRTFLITTVLIGVLFGWLSDCYQRAKREKASLVYFKNSTSFGSEVVYDFQEQKNGAKSGKKIPPGPKWLRRLLGNHIFSRVVELHLTDNYSLGGSEKAIRTLEPLSSFRELRHLEIQCQHENQLLITSFDGIQNCKKLVSLKIQNATELKEVTALGASKDLTSVIFDGCEEVESLDGLHSHRNLETLVLDNCMKLKNLDAIRNIQLKTLEVNECEQLKDFSGIENSPSLEYLQIDFTNWSPDSYCRTEFSKLLPRMAKLVNLSLSMDKSLVNFEVLESCDQLETLKLEFCDGLISLKGVQELEQLRVLELVNCSSLSDISHLTGHPSLKRLVIRHCHRIKDVVGIGEMALLNQLRICSCSSVSSINELASLPALQHLELSEIKLLSTLAGVENCPDLRSVEVFACDELEDISPISRLALIERLALRKCASLTDIRPIADLRTLERVNLRLSDQIRDWSPLYELPRLCELDITGSGADDYAIRVEQLIQNIDPIRCKVLINEL